MSFIKSYEFSTPLVENLKEMGFQQPTPIQSQAIPLILEGKDIAGLAQTGTGKTGAYLIPLIENQLKGWPKHVEAAPFESYPLVLVLVPTRELTEQVNESFTQLSKGTPLKGAAIFGGGSIDKQKEILKKGVHFIFATPGRLIDLYENHGIDLNRVKAVVFDEADRMFDMGFKEDMIYLLKRIPRHRQMLLFSATLNFDVLGVAYEFESDPIELNISKDQLQTDNVEAFLYHISEGEKPRYLLSLLKKHQVQNVVVFTNYRNQVELLTEFLKKNNIPAVGISSLMRQSQRQVVIKKIKSDSGVNILVGTDVAARGLDIQGVDLVVNYDLPSHSEVYVHRIGRTGRADNKGLALNLASERDVEALGRIEDFLGEKIPTAWLEDQELILDFTGLDEVKKKLFGKKKEENKQNPKFSYRGERTSTHGSHKRERQEEEGGGTLNASRIRSKTSSKNRSSGQKSSLSSAHSQEAKSRTPKRKGTESYREGSQFSNRNGSSQSSSPSYRSSGERRSRGNSYSTPSQRGSTSARVKPSSTSPGLLGRVKSLFKKILG